ncbi:hypothetical protein BDP27DRAFT_1330355, partial [Rhodocollybia butyracea]
MCIISTERVLGLVSVHYITLFLYLFPLRGIFPITLGSEFIVDCIISLYLHFVLCIFFPF